MKTVMWVVGIAILLVAGVGVYLMLNSGSLIKRGIETLGPEYLGTGVHVDRVDLSVVEGSGALYGLQIDNPSGFAGPYAMQLGEIAIVLDTDRLSQDLVVIKEMRIDGAKLAAVMKGTKTNLQKIMDNLDAATASTSNGGDVDSSASETKFIIENFAFTNAHTSVSSEVLGDMELSIADIYLSDIGRKTDGATASEVLRQVLSPVYEAISRGMLSAGLDVEGMEANLKSKAVEKISEKFGLKSLTEQLGRQP